VKTAPLLGVTSPDEAGFLDLAGQGLRVIPVVRRYLADAETPISLYRKVAGSKPGTFWVEAAEHGGLFSRYSFIGAASSAVLTCDKGLQAVWLGQVPQGVDSLGDVMDVLESALKVLASPPLPGLPPLTGGLVGAIGYDAVRVLETVAIDAPRELKLPALSMVIASDLAVMDHREGTVTLIANALNWDGKPAGAREAYAGAVERLDEMTRALAAPAASTVEVFDEHPVVRASERTKEPQFIEAVEAAQQAIVDGEVFQLVLSQRFDTKCRADALDVYRALRASNPSPYMYLLRLLDARGERFDIVGSSPEALVTADATTVTTHPIAGSRPRGATTEADEAMSEELLADPKERAEHVMLVDLARNDLAKVCTPGSVEVVQFFGVERYSHIMHIVSTVTGQREEDASAVDILRATFPAGTLTGAPKVRAMELIDKLEPARRGIYGGAIGYMDFAGNLDLAIAIRTAVIRKGRASVQAGAGIVADSVATSEYEESCNKARAVLLALAQAESFAPPAPISNSGQ
jgi:anthranilate synthase component 1